MSKPAASVLSLIEALVKPQPPDNLAIPVFADDSIEVEIYAPRGEDVQTPHDRDEVYVIARGTGTFFDGAGRHAVSSGSFLFVPARRQHRFESFSADFAAWVFFYGPVRA